MRAAVVVVDRGWVALIERRSALNAQPYYLFPGGGVEAGEAPEDAARREAAEELGVVVRLDGLLAMGAWRDAEHYYYLARIVGGAFGVGNGEEMRTDVAHPNGSYTAVWLRREELPRRDVRPKSLAALLAAEAVSALTAVLRIED